MLFEKGKFFIANFIDIYFDPKNILTDDSETLCVKRKAILFWEICSTLNSFKQFRHDHLINTIHIKCYLPHKTFG